MPTIQEIPDDTPLSSPLFRPTVETTPERAKTHRRKASLVSPVAITASSPAARRMSKRGTSQAALLDDASLSGLKRWALVIERKAGLLAAVIIVGIVLTGTAYAELYSLALNTSFSLVPPIERTAYFAQKSNPFNQYGVKLSWLHTSIAYLFHLITSPPSSPSTATISSAPRQFRDSGSKRGTRRTRSKRSRLWSYLLTSALWFAFTSWFFGYGLGDRVIQLSGGQCVIPIPAEWEVERGGVQAVLSHVPISVGAYLMPEEASGKAAGVTKDTGLAAGSSVSADSKASPDATETADPILLGVPAELCVKRQPLSPKNREHRDIFAILTHLPFPPHLKHKSPSTTPSPRSHAGGAMPGLTIPRPRWYKGHDISGHTVALTIASLLLVRELAPTWARWLRAAQVVLGRSADQPAALRMQSSAQGDLRELGHGVATALGTALLGLWVFMLGVTAVYFHSPEEKLSGLALGLAISLITYLFSPGSSRATLAASGVTTNELASAFDSSDEDTLPSQSFASLPAKARGSGAGGGVVDENTARRLAAEALQAAEKEADEVAEAQRAIRAEMDAVLAGKEKAA